MTCGRGSRTWPTQSARELLWGHFLKPRGAGTVQASPREKRSWRRVVLDKSGPAKEWSCIGVVSKKSKFSPAPKNEK